MSLDVNKLCVICRDSICEKEKLFKICVCADSLVCEECYDILNQQKIVKCPVCKQKLKCEIEKNIFRNLLIYLNYNKLVFFNFILNLIIVNIVLTNTYYYNSEYPITDDKEFYLRKKIYLKDYKYHTSYIIYQKICYFFIINTFNLVIYPVSYVFINLALLNRDFVLNPYISKYNKAQLYINITLQFISIFLCLVLKKRFLYLQIYITSISAFYSIKLCVFLVLFLFVLLIDNFKYVKNKYMNIKYNIKINKTEKYQKIENNYLSVSAV